MQTGEHDSHWTKAITPKRDRRQSAALIGVVVPLLLWRTLAMYLPLHGPPQTWLRQLLFPLLLSLGFAFLVWLLRAATLPAAAVGLLVCLILARSPHAGPIPSLITLFVLTFAATRLGRSAKERRGLAEPRNGRKASQVIANLGAAALWASAGWYVACIAALAEAAADTVSSEIGQAWGGRPWLITTLRRVPLGKDGGISLAGTAAGVAAAALVVSAAGLRQQVWPAFAAACAGLLFDSLLGATVEERGWIGNDLVNFASTLFSALLMVAWELHRIHRW